MLVLERRAEETLRSHCSLFFVPGLSQVKPLHSHSRYLARLPVCPRVLNALSHLSVFPAELLDSLSLFCICLSEPQSGCMSVCTCLCLYLPDMPSPSVAPCSSVCPQGGACKGASQAQSSELWVVPQSEGRLGPSGCVFSFRLSICPSFLETGPWPSSSAYWVPRKMTEVPSQALPDSTCPQGPPGLSWPLVGVWVVCA